MDEKWFPWVAGIIEGEGTFAVQRSTLAGGQKKALNEWFASDPTPKREILLCGVVGCERPRHGRGLCGTHWWQWRHKGLHAEIAAAHPPRMLHVSALS